MEKKMLLPIVLHPILHIDMKHLGKQEKSSIVKCRDKCQSLDFVCD